MSVCAVVVGKSLSADVALQSRQRQTHNTPGHMAQVIGGHCSVSHGAPWETQGLHAKSVPSPKPQNHQRRSPTVCAAKGGESSSREAVQGNGMLGFFRRRPGGVLDAQPCGEATGSHGTSPGQRCEWWSVVGPTTLIVCMGTQGMPSAQDGRPKLDARRPSPKSSRRGRAVQGRQSRLTID